jgi:hypothetical protein
MLVVRLPQSRVGAVDAALDRERVTTTLLLLPVLAAIIVLLAVDTSSRSTDRD